MRAGRLFLPTLVLIGAAASVPVVLFHGMGDTADSEGYVRLQPACESNTSRMRWVKDQIVATYPGTFVHSIRIGPDEQLDRISTMYDNLNRQIDEVCAQLAAIKELFVEGFDGIGFSQGGQFLRAYVERCNEPRMRNLITVGAQHQGVYDFPHCTKALSASSHPRDGPPAQHEGDILVRYELAQSLLLLPARSPATQAAGGTPSEECEWWLSLVKRGAYTDFVQRRIVQAQYFKDPARIDEYYAKSNFLADINNERARPALQDQLESGSAETAKRYGDNIAALDNFVMFMFELDEQVRPKESSWFGYYDGAATIELRRQAIFTEDWIGLKRLDEKGGLHFELLEGCTHMQLPTDLVTRHLAPWLGPRGPA